ncbi:MAG: sulfotransferase domain-containing protein [Cyanobacteria bacterium P01_B01_bin.77]
MNLAYKVLVGTHHKTGTGWMASLFKRICQQFQLSFFSGNQEELPEYFDIFFQPHSQFSFDKLHLKYKGLHLIRDPRDRIISGCFYHQNSQEEWLYLKQKKFGGLTYQEKINSYTSLDDQLIFEMENSGLNDIQEMLNWNYSNSSFIEVKYEELILDKDLILFREIFNFLGFPDEHLSKTLNIVRDSSLFSDIFKDTKRRNTGHIRSGKPEQWREYFKHTHRVKFLELFNDALIKLGYEENDAWVNN